MGSLCVIGGGWAGIAAAVESVRRGERTTLLEMAPQLGGRARGVQAADHALDNGQHILIGAYRETLDLMHMVGADAKAMLERRPLELIYPDGTGLRLPSGRPIPALLLGVLGAKGWSWNERCRLLGRATGWGARGFRCNDALSVAALCAGMPFRIRRDLIDPLCVAALNTPSEQASAAVFLRVLRDALLGAPGSADLLLPRLPLSDLLPRPAHQWLLRSGADIRLGTRAHSLQPEDSGWRVDGDRFDRVVLACSAGEAARLCRDFAGTWSDTVRDLVFEPIVTVYLKSSGTRLSRPMLALRSGADAPAQFIFDRGHLGDSKGVFAAVVSGAGHWAQRGAAATAQAVCEQLDASFPRGTWSPNRSVLRVLVEKRATFLCRPGLSRPRAWIAPGLCAAGDYVDGPYPSTLEGAVRSGRDGVQLLYQSTNHLFAMQNSEKRGSC